MARRRATRWTRSKKSKDTSLAVIPNSDAPSPREWETMQPFGKFNVVDEDGTGYLFKVGDNAMILPENADRLTEINKFFDHSYWVGKIKDIRCRQLESGPDVWAYIQWYYSGGDAKSVIDSFDPSQCSKYERMLSDTYDYVSSSSFEDVIKVKRYYEDSIDQVDIEEDDFFYRYELEYTARRISQITSSEEAVSGSRKPGANSCICKVPYNPSDPSVLMHFCPRPSCRRWYHEKCLKGIKSTLSPALNNTNLDAGQHYLETSPFTDDLVSLPNRDVVTLTPPAKRRRVRTSKSNSQSRTRSSSETRSPGKTIVPIDDSQDSIAKQRYDSLPHDLLEAAQQPIVKGHALGPGYIVGNIRLVAEARRTVYAVIVDGEELDEGWEELINPTAALVDQTLQLFLCPKCRSVI